MKYTITGPKENTISLLNVSNGGVFFPFSPVKDETPYIVRMRCRNRCVL